MFIYSPAPRYIIKSFYHIICLLQQAGLLQFPSLKGASMKSAFPVSMILLAMMIVGTASATPIQIYGTWHCGNDACTWATVRNMTDFDAKNHWIIDRGDGGASANLVVLAFVNPLKLLNQTNDSGTVNGVPIGMNQQVISYFTSHNIRVMLSIGGITFVNDWDTALSTNATQLGLNAAAVAKSLGVGIEIDYEQNTNPNMSGLQAFINAYRSQLPYDASGANPAARLTIDVGAGDRFLIGIDRMATANWLTTANPVLDYANALVPSRPPNSAS